MDSLSKGHLANHEPPNLAAPQDPNVYINQQRETIRRLEGERDGWKKQYEACHKLHLEAQEECEKANTFAYKLEAASLQARLTASEAKVKEMEQACDQRKLTRKQQVELDKIIGSRDREINTLRNRLARKTLKWTTARPTVAGWYWWRFRVSTIPIIRCLQWDDDVQEFYDDVGTENKTLNELGGEWQGPITPGEE